MKLSIITINYNNASGLKKTIESVLNQNNKAFEYIIIDGGSTDDSVDVIKAYQDNFTYWKSAKDQGIYDAMNRGIEVATGLFLMFLNSGDYLHSESVLEICIEHITKFQKVDIFYGDIFVVNEKNKEPWIRTHPSKLDLFFWKNDNINHQASLIKSDLFKEFGLYPTQYKLAGDHWMFFKSFVAGKMFKHVPIPLVAYDLSGTSETNKFKYNNEMEHIWNFILPEYVHDLIIDNNEKNMLLNKGFIKRIIKAYESYHEFKQRIKIAFKK